MRINRSIENGTFASAPALVDAFSRAKSGTKRMHFLGLVSDGGVHSHITHLFELLKGLLPTTPAHASCGLNRTL